MNNCIADKLGDKIHFCGIPRIDVMDNLRMKHPNIEGLTAPVILIIYPCQEAELEKTRLAAEKAADRFKKMFQQN